MTKVTDSGGTVVQAMAFDAWGLRRDATDWSDLASPFAGSHETERGYTGHEHLDNVGLIHMNGRVQDPVLGRFMSADPIIQEPYHTQSHNRYSYVWNNPTSMTDPSGFCVSRFASGNTCPFSQTGSQAALLATLYEWANSRTISMGHYFAVLEGLHDVDADHLRGWYLYAFVMSQMQNAARAYVGGAGERQEKLGPIGISGPVTDEDRSAIREALSHTESLTNNALRRVARARAGSEADRAIFREFFGAATPANLDTVEGHFRAVRSALEAGGFLIVNDPSSSDYGYVRSGETDRVYLRKSILEHWNFGL